MSDAGQADHGGNLDDARRRFGGAPSDWIDLSTGINPVPYPVGQISPQAWCALPLQSDLRQLEAQARTRYRGDGLDCVALAGAQTAIQLVPRLRAPGQARVLTPTYNEHARSLGAQGWGVEEVTRRDALAGAELAVLVNPNNPDGRRASPAQLVALAQDCGLLVVDESFVDPTPDLSVVPHLDGIESILVLRSFGKFYGLAGLRVGFVLGAPGLVTQIRRLLGPWALSGPALEVAMRALADDDWHARTVNRLTQDAARLDACADRLGWSLVGGTTLFRTYQTPDALRAQTAFAQNHIWTRVFPYSQTWIRLGLPGDGAAWQRVEQAFAAAAP